MRGKRLNHVVLLLAILAGGMLLAAQVPLHDFVAPVEHHEDFGHETSHHEEKAEKLTQYQQINQWHLEQYAYFLEKLKSIKEGEGTLLDNCMVVLGAGMRDGNSHSPKNLPIIVGGNGGGTIATGRHVKYEEGTPLANLWQSMLKRVGTPVEKFADSTGELVGLDDPNFTGKA